MTEARHGVRGPDVAACVAGTVPMAVTERVAGSRYQADDLAVLAITVPSGSAVTLVPPVPVCVRPTGASSG